MILGKGPTQGLEHTLSAEKMYSINFTKENTKFCLSLHYNGANSYLFVNGKEIFIHLQQKILKLIHMNYAYEIYQKDWSVDNTKKTGLKRYIYDFSVDYDDISISDITDIHKYLMEKNKIN